MQRLILVVDDEKPIVDILKFNLTNAGYKVVAAYDGEEALRLFESENPDLVLLDVMLPKMDGFEVCRRIRGKRSTPILMLTARGEEIDQVLGLEFGADDYIAKPFMMRALMARVKANLRRIASEGGEAEAEGEELRFGDLLIKPARYEVRKRDQILELTLREFELLKFMSAQPDKIFTREVLLEKVWGYEYFGDVRTVDVTVRRLREKVEDDPANPAHIMTKRGVGYYFKQ